MASNLSWQSARAPLPRRLPMLDAMRELMRPPPGMACDFSQPPGEPALAPAGGVSWRVFANPVTLFVGGVTAVLLELAEPSVRSGVWDHSSFQRDPGMRLRRTGFAAMMSVYGPRSATEKLIADVVRIHGHIEGATPDGVVYRANDPRLLDWVHATAVFGFTEAYHHYAGALSAADKDVAFAEGHATAWLYGATGAPRTWDAWETLLAVTAPGLEGSDVLADFMRIMAEAPILPAPMRWLQRLLVRAAVEITPEPVRSLPQLRGRGLRFGEATLMRALARRPLRCRWTIPQPCRRRGGWRHRRNDAMARPEADLWQRSTVISPGSSVASIRFGWRDW